MLLNQSMFFKIQIFIAILPRTLFSGYTSEKNSQVFEITVKNKNNFKMQNRV